MCGAAQSTTDRNNSRVEERQATLLIPLMRVAGEGPRQKELQATRRERALAGARARRRGGKKQASGMTRALQKMRDESFILKNIFSLTSATSTTQPWTSFQVWPSVRPMSIVTTETYSDPFVHSQVQRERERDTTGHPIPYQRCGLCFWRKPLAGEDGQNSKNREDRTTRLTYILIRRRAR